MDKKNTLLLTVIAVATLLVAIVGATFAYFTAQTGAGQEVKIDVTTKTSDSSTFNVMSDLTINATQENFGETTTGKGAHSLGASSYGVVSLKANNNTKKKDLCYRAGLIVNSNNFIYSLPKTSGEPENGDGYYPELLLRVWKISENGQDVKELKANGVQDLTFEDANEYGKTILANQALPTIEGTDTTALKTGDPSSSITIPYKSSSDIKSTVTTVCPRTVGNSDDTESCTEITGLSGFDITMLGFSAGQSNTATKEFSDESLNNIIGKKIVVIPAGAENYAHKISVDKSSTTSPTETELTATDYWKVSLTFVNYSDSDINAPAESTGTTKTQWQQAHGDSVHYADQNNNTGKLFSAVFRFEPLDSCPAA